jgi:hypothetical protein
VVLSAIYGLLYGELKQKEILDTEFGTISKEVLMSGWWNSLIVLLIIALYLGLGSLARSYAKAYWLKEGVFNEQSWKDREKNWWVTLAVFIFLLWWLYWPIHWCGRLGHRLGSESHETIATE